MDKEKEDSQVACEDSALNKVRDRGEKSRFPGVKEGLVWNMLSKRYLYTISQRSPPSSTER